jgi:hypothetical protein
MEYIGNIESVLTEQFLDRCIRHAQEYNPRGRSPDEVLNQTIHGEAVEVLVQNYLGLEEAPFEIPEYDATDYKGRKYEIKHTIKDDKWWNFKIENYNFFLQNAHKLDFIVLCYLNQDSSEVFLKWIADAETFERFISKSNYNDGWYYNVKNAIKAGRCKEIESSNSHIKRQW